MKTLGPYLVRRLAQGLLVLFVIACFNFVLVHSVPGDAAEVLAGQVGGADPDYVAAVRRSFGLDQPLPVQFGLYLWNLAHLNLGFSYQYQQPVSEVIVERLPATLLLLAASLGFALVGGVGLGIAAARRAGTWFDGLISVASLVGYALPVFWFGLMLVVLFSVKWGLLPSGGLATIGADFGPVEGAWDVARHLVLPALTLGVFFMATYTRLMRTQTRHVYALEFVRTARAKGLSERRIAYRHVLRNAILPIVTMFGIQIGSALGGAVVVEVVFAWPGLGRLAFDALSARDVNLLLGQLFFCSVLVVLTNLAIDLLYVAVDPRIELQAAAR